MEERNNIGGFNFKKPQRGFFKVEADDISAEGRHFLLSTFLFQRKVETLKSWNYVRSKFRALRRSGGPGAKPPARFAKRNRFLKDKSEEVVRDEGRVRFEGEFQ